jgi:hypothetical protein
MLPLGLIIYFIYMVISFLRDDGVFHSLPASYKRKESFCRVWIDTWGTLAIAAKYASRKVKRAGTLNGRED